MIQQSYLQLGFSQRELEAAYMSCLTVIFLYYFRFVRIYNLSPMYYALVGYALTVLFSCLADRVISKYSWLAQTIIYGGFARPRGNPPYYPGPEGGGFCLPILVGILLPDKNVCHDVKKFIMTSKSSSWRQTIRHDVKNTS